MQAQITKTATKVAAKKAAAKPAVKKAAGRAVRAAKPVSKPAINYVIQDYARPKQGSLLFAFTAAWLELTGISDGKAAPRATLVKIAGETAIAYHTKNGNLEKTPDGLAMTAKGNAFFAARKVDPQLKDAFTEVFAKGQVSDLVHVKAQAAIVKAA